MMKLLKLKKLTRVALILAISSTAMSATANELSAPQVNEDNRWYDLTTQRVPFLSNTLVKRQIHDLNIELETRGVVFGYELDNIADIQPGGFLKIISDNGDGNISLKAFADSDGNIGYDYRINDIAIEHLPAAQQFLAETLDKVLGKDGVHAWRVHCLKHLADPRVQNDGEKVKQKVLTKRVLQATVDNYHGYFSSDEVSLAEELLDTDDWRGSDRTVWNFEVIKAHNPFSDMLVASKSDFAVIDKQGELKIFHLPMGGQMQSAAYNLNNDILISTYLLATGQAYEPGKTEKALAEFLVRVHWQRPASLLTWMES